MVPQPFIFPQTKDTTTTTEVESCGAGLWFLCVGPAIQRNKKMTHKNSKKDINSPMTWEYDWQMHFNPQKCFVMRLTCTRHLTRFNYILGDKSLQETDNHPYLGIHITKDLTWNKHVHQITATANRIPLHW